MNRVLQAFSSRKADRPSKALLKVSLFLTWEPFNFPIFAFIASNCLGAFCGHFRLRALICRREQIFFSHPTLLQIMIEMDLLEVGRIVCIISQGPDFPGRAGVEGGASFLYNLHHGLIISVKVASAFKHSEGHCADPLSTFMTAGHLAT